MQRNPLLSWCLAGLITVTAGLVTTTLLIPTAQAQKLNGLYKAQAGSYAVGVVDNLTLSDRKRGRSIPLKVYYPEGPGPFPVIIFSHGGGGSKDAFSELSQYWASQGYASIHPTHSDREVKESLGGNTLAMLEKNKSDSTLWIGRVADITAILDALGQLQQQNPQLRGKFDSQRIGMAGHSFGAYTTLLLAGALVDTAQGQNQSFRDPRIKAFIGISPQGSDERGLDNQAWGQVTAPVMTISGTREKGDTRRMEAYRAMPAGDKYHMVIEGANHSSYNDAKSNKRGNNRRKKDNSQVKEYTHTFTESTSQAFWDAYLKRDNTALQYLGSKSPQTYSSGLVDFYSK